jgi:DNA polymerase-3 subunit epsilon
MVDVGGIRNVLVFDTETTGRANFGLPGSHPSQPLPVQLGVLMYHVPEGTPFTFEDAREVHRVNLIIDQPKEIAEGAQAVHGISAELAQQVGVSLETAMFVFDDMASKADLLVCHNFKFDIRVMEQTYVQCGHHAALWQTIASKSSFCTMQAATPVLKLPKASGHKGNKWPKLEECIDVFFGEKIDGAHDALVDVEATARVFFHIIKLLTEES